MSETFFEYTEKRLLIELQSEDVDSLKHAGTPTTFMQVRSSKGGINFEVGVFGPDCGSGLAADFYFKTT